MRRAVLAAAVLAASCGGAAKPEAPRPEAPSQAAPPAPAVAERPRLAARAPGAQNAPRLPEDPEAAKRATAQWNEHLAEEDHNRQLVFDRDRMPAHQGLLKLVVAARARYDRARNEAALNAARDGMPAQLAKIQERVTKLDPWGTGSRLLSDYAALQAALAASYPDAKLAALRGDAGALSKAQADFDQRLHAMREWLEEATHAKGEGEEGEEEQERALETSRR